MSPYTIPVNGLYRIYIPSDNSLYMELNESDSLVHVVPYNEQSNNQKWNIRQVSSKADTYKITSFDDKRVLNWKQGAYKGSLFVESGATTEWIVEYKSPHAPRVTTADKKSEGHYVDSCDRKTAHFWTDNQHGVDQHWAFELIQGDGPQPLGPGSSSKLSPNSFKDKFFNLTVEQAAKPPAGKEYDIIIVGSGIGGGVLANDLWDTNLKVGDNAKRVLLLEKGDIVFHSHCLNTARPAGLANDRGQQNDTFFHNFKEEFTFNPPLPETEWKGGPMYNLGGRSAAWGLFAPRIHDKNLEEYMNKDVVKELKSEYYDRAERLMFLSLPNTKRVHQHVMDTLNMDGLTADSHSNVQWQWGRIASEFHDDQNFDFAEGAYSTIDKILEIAMSRRIDETTKKPIEHDHFKTVLGADVRSLNFDKDKNVTGVNVRTSEGKMVPISVKKGGSVVLCAGSVHSPAILLRSGPEWAEKLARNGGLHLTDHDIFFYTASFRYNDPKQRDEVGPMKLQTNVELDGEYALANMSVDASSFLPRGESPDESVPKFIMVFILQRPLVEKNTIWIDPKTDEPVVKMQRGKEPKAKQVATMKKLTAAAMNSLRDSLGVKFIGYEQGQDVDERNITLGKLQLGGVAHELGTLPMDIDGTKNVCLDTDLRMVPELCNGVYVCDLSLFPWSPEANPTLTLAALGIRCSRHLHKRITITDVPEANQVTVVNHSGSRIKVWLTAYKPDGVSGQAEPPLILEPGKDKTWVREPDMPQGLFVFRRDHATTDENVFLSVPDILTAHPKKVNPVHAGRG